MRSNSGNRLRGNCPRNRPGPTLRPRNDAPLARACVWIPDQRLASPHLSGLTARGNVSAFSFVILDAAKRRSGIHSFPEVCSDLLVAASQTKRLPVYLAVAQIGSWIRSGTAWWKSLLILTRRASFSLGCGSRKTDCSCTDVRDHPVGHAPQPWFLRNLLERCFALTPTCSRIAQ